MGLTIGRVDDGEGSASLSIRGFVELSPRQELVDRGRAVPAEDRSLTPSLSSVEFMDSTGVGALVGLAKACERDGKSITTSAATLRVPRVLDATGMADA